jgi:hypothetical protein
MAERSEIHLTVELRRDNNEREWHLHGASLADVTFLRRRGFVVYRDGRRYRVDDRRLTREGIAALARRERRLLKHTNGEK